MADGPIFHIEPKGGFGSRMIQYMVALSFQHLVPGCRISNVRLPEWGIDCPPLPLPDATEQAEQPHHIEMAGLAARALTGALRGVVYRGLGQRLENFPDIDTCRAVFRPPVITRARFDARHLICHIRAEELSLGVKDPDGPLTPIEFFSDIVAETGLIPVFVGRTVPNAYTGRLRRRFPQGVFLEAGDTISDFEIIRQAKNIVIGVSTFAWMAAWLSHAERIFVAVSGRFNPMQVRAVDLLPFDDPRYRFYLFPINYTVPLQRHAEYHARLAPLCRYMRNTDLLRLFREAPRFDPSTAQMLEEFDPEYYLSINEDVAGKFGRDNADGARHHYRQAGVREQRMPFGISAGWYAEQYPTAALQVAQGDYSDFAQHYVAIGRARRYRLLPVAGWEATTDDQPAPATRPSIELLAKEIVALEKPALAEDEFTSLGDSFRTLLAPSVAADFMRVHMTEAVHIYRLRDVTLDASMMVLLHQRQLIRETLYMTNEDDYEYARVKPLHPEPTNATFHYIIGCNRSWQNYYHWMAQSLPAIDWGLRKRRDANVALAVPPLQPRQVEALALLGYADVPRLTLQPSSHYALASAEYAEFLGARMDLLVSAAAAETYARLRQAVTPAADGADAIYVARTDTDKRIAVNEAALIALLEREGVRIVVPGMLPVAQQLAGFRRARLVIGPHGAGLSNIIGCEPGTHVYELVPCHYPNHCYNRLAQICRLHWWGDVFPGEDSEAEPTDRNWRVDLDLVAARLDEIRTCMAAMERVA